MGKSKAISTIPGLIVVDVRAGRGRGRGRGRGGDDEKAWVPCTKLGRLVKEKKIKVCLNIAETICALNGACGSVKLSCALTFLQSIEYIYLHSLPIKECEIIDYFLGGCVQLHWSCCWSSVLMLHVVFAAVRTAVGSRMR